MIDAVSSSLSGLNNASRRLETSAQRIASASSVTKASPSAQGGEVNLTEEVVNSKLAEVNYSANAKMIRAELDNEKKILDILA